MKEQKDKLTQRINDMSSDFSNMLKDTLENMKKKISQANEKWDAENDNAML